VKRFSMTKDQIEGNRQKARKRMKRGLMDEVVNARDRIEKPRGRQVGEMVQDTTRKVQSDDYKVNKAPQGKNPRAGQAYREYLDSKGREVHDYGAGQKVTLKDNVRGLIKPKASAQPGAPSPNAGQPAPAAPVDNSGQRESQLNAIAQRQAAQTQEKKKRKPFPLTRGL
jgi:hypothetical protein